MKSHLTSGIADFGNRIFRWRRLFYFIPVMLLFITRKDLQYPCGKYFFDEFLEFLIFSVVLLGVGIRLWASGSSRRFFVKKAGKSHIRFETKGVYSLVRNPYFLGEFLIVAGLSFLLFDAPLIILSILFFLMSYTPILMAREKMLLDTYPVLYRAYCRKVHLMIPSFRSWRKSGSRFRWLVALQKEGNLLGAMGILFFCLEQFREIEIQGSWNPNPLWISLVIPFFLFCLVLRSLDPRLKDLPDMPGTWDD